MFDNTTEVDGICKGYKDYLKIKQNVLILDISSQHENLIKFLRKIRKTNQNIKIIVMCNSWVKNVLESLPVLRIDSFVCQSIPSFELFNAAKRVLAMTLVERKESRSLFGKLAILEQELTLKEISILHMLFDKKDEYISGERLEAAIFTDVESFMFSIAELMEALMSRLGGDMLIHVPMRGYKLNLKPQIIT